MTGRRHPRALVYPPSLNNAVDFPFPACSLSTFCFSLAMERFCLGSWRLMLSCNTLGRCLADFGHNKLGLRAGFCVTGVCLCLDAVLGFTRMQGRQLGTSWVSDIFCGHTETVKSGRFLFRATDTPCSRIENSGLA